MVRSYDVTSMAMLSFLLLPRTFSQLPSAVCQFKVSIEVELSRLPTLSAVMECSEQSLPAPAIKEEYAESSTVSRQIKEETVFVDVGGVQGKSDTLVNSSLAQCFLDG